jgi:hypothetical protein
MPVSEIDLVEHREGSEAQGGVGADPASATPGISNSATAASAATFVIASPRGRTPGPFWPLLRRGRQAHSDLNTRVDLNE